MSKVRLLLALVALSIAWWVLFSAGKASGKDRPNVIVILTDNQGAWTLGCYGNPDIRTPNIDRLAREGVLFTRAYACNPVCSPNRATLLTGLMPSQHGVHCYLVGGRLQVGPKARNTLEEYRSLGEILSEAGYRCGLVGKWHLGDNLNPHEGFDGYWVTMPHGHTATFYGAEVIEGGKIRRERGYLTDFWTRHALHFIRQAAAARTPFFLLLAYNGPYGLGSILTRPAQNRHAGYYAARDLPSFPRRKPHPWLFNNRQYINNLAAMRRVAAETSAIDDGVGKIVQALRELEIYDETLLVYLADQGWVGGQGGFWGMGDHTRPFTLRGEMLRIPLIWHWPARLASGKACARLVSIYDVPVTLLDVLGLRFPQNPPRPGRSFAPVLFGGDLNDWEECVFMEFQHVRGLRTPRWHYVYRAPGGPHELYDLEHDPEELTNLWGRAEFFSVRWELHERLVGFFRRYSDPRWDLWSGGGSQTRLLR